MADPLDPKGAPSPIEPAYEDYRPGNDIPLYRGPLRLVSSRIDVRGTGWIDYVFEPDPRTVFSFVPPSHVTMEQAAEVCSLHVDDPPLECDCVVTNIGERVSGLLSGEAASRCSRDLSVVRFPVANLRAFRGESIATGRIFEHRCEMRKWAGRLDFCAHGWHVVIDAPEWHHEADNRLKASGGFGVTHNGALERIDGEPFSAGDAVEVIRALGLFLSFCQGAHCGPILARGFDRHGDCAWYDWTPVTLDRRQDRPTWFSPVHAREHVDGAFPGFLEKWSDPLWSDVLRRAVHWYIQANTRSAGTEGALVLGQVALEMLAWSVCAEVGKKKEERKAFKKRRASEKMGALLREAGVSSALPDSLADLKRWVSGWGDADGPRAITKMRNSIVHHTYEHRRLLSDASGMAVWQALTLTLHYLENALLWLIGYNGLFHNRTTRRSIDEVEPVPWSCRNP